MRHVRVRTLSRPTPTLSSLTSPPPQSGGDLEVHGLPHRVHHGAAPAAAVRESVSDVEVIHIQTLDA